MQAADRAAREPPELQMGQPRGIRYADRLALDRVQVADTNNVSWTNLHRVSWLTLVVSGLGIQIATPDRTLRHSVNCKGYRDASAHRPSGKWVRARS